MNICILAEKNKFEKRTPLVPSDITKICNQSTSIKFYYQPSKQRIIPDNDFIEAGCEMYRNQKIDLFLSIKACYPSLVKKKIAFIIFSELFESNPQNIQFTKKILKLKASLLDYKLFKNKKNENLFTQKEYNQDDLKYCKKFSANLAGILVNITKSLDKDTIEEYFIIKKGYLSYHYIKLISLFI